MDEYTKEISKNLTELTTSVSKLWRVFGELSTDYWGPNKDNGMRSIIRQINEIEIKKLVEAISELERACQHYIDAERRATCIGLAALEEYRAEQKEAQEQEKKEEKELTETEGVIEVEKIKANSATVVQILTLLGVVLGPALLEIVKELAKGH